MANSYTEYTASSVTTSTQFATPSYITGRGATDISVTVSGVTQASSAYTLTGTNITFAADSLPTDGAKILITRTTSQNARINTYSENTVLTPAQLNTDGDQSFMMAQEALDQASKTNLAAGTFYYAQGTAPTNVAVGTVWFNTASSPNTLQVWCGDTEGWRFVAPVHETTRYTNASGIYFPVNGQPNSGADAQYAGLAKIHDTGFTSSSYFHLNGVKQVSGTLAEVNATPATADYVFDQANNNIWFKPIANTDLIVIEAFSGSFSQEVTAKEAAALNHRNDAEKLAINAENSQFTLSDGVTTDYSAKHFKALAEAARDAAQTAQGLSESARDASQTAQGLSENARDASQTAQGLSEGARDASQTAQGLSEGARDTALSHKNLAQEYATKAEDTNITGGTDKSALHYAAKAAASATAAAGSESNAASTLANAVTLDTNQTITGDKKFGSSANLYVDGGQSIKFGDAAVTTTTVDGTDHTQYPLEIFVTNDNTTAYIRENATNNLAIEGQDVSIRDRDGNRRVYTTGGDSGGHVALYHGNNNTPKMTTSSTGVTVNGIATADGLTLGDSDYIKIGEGDGAGTPDLQIFSGGGNAFIEQPSGSGNNNNLIIRGQNINLRNDADATLISTDNDQVRMWTQVAGAEDSTNGAAKFSTTTTGIDVNGTVTADGLNVDTSNNFATINVGTAYLDVIGTDATSGLKLSNTNNTTAGQSDILFQRTENPVVNGTNTGIGQMLFEADNSGGSPFLFAGITAYADQFTAGSEEAFFAFTVEDGTGSRNEKLRINKDGIDVTGTVSADGISVGDDENITLGNSNDLVIKHHAGGGSSITETGSGNLALVGNAVTINNLSDSATQIVCDGDGTGNRTKLYSGQPSDSSDYKLSTLPTGVDVKGTVTADTFQLDTASTEFRAFTDSQDVTWLAKNGTGTLKLKSYKPDGAASTADDGIHIRTDDLKLKNNSGGDIAQFSYDSATGTKAVNIDGTVTADALDIDGAVDVNTSNGNVDFDMGSGTFTITSTNTGDQLLLTNTNTGSGLDGAPDIVLRNLYTNVSEIVDNNILGSLHFGGNTLNVAGDAISGTTENFGRILCLSNDVTDGTHDGILDFRVADNGTVATRMQVKPDGIDVTGTVTATGIALNGNMETDGNITVQNGHEIKLEAADGSESLSIGTNNNNATTIHEQGSGNLNIKGDALVLYGNNRDLSKITVHDEGGVKIDSELGTDTTVSYTRIKVGNQHTGTRFYCGTDETNVRAEVVSAGLNVNGTVTATSITASQTAEVDTTDKTMANFKGQKVIHTGTTATYEFPDVVAGDKGTTWTVVNAGTGDITISRADGATPNFSKLVTSSNPSSLTGLTLAKGGTIEMVVTAADTITCFGSGF